MWKLTLSQRIRMGAGLVFVCLLVIATNRMDSSYFAIVQQNLTSVYKDRLVAKDYLYKISRQLQIKKNSYYSKDPELVEKTNKAANREIKLLVAKFSRTELTDDEAIYFKSLNNDLNKLFKLEQSSSTNELINEELPSLDVKEELYADLFQDLDELSKIQLEEGAKKISNSTKAIDASNFISRMEIGALIAIAILLQILIFYRPKH